MRKSEKKSWYREIEIAVFPSLTSMTKDLKDDAKAGIKRKEKEEKTNEKNSFVRSLISVVVVRVSGSASEDLSMFI